MKIFALLNLLIILNAQGLESFLLQKNNNTKKIIDVNKFDDKETNEIIENINKIVFKEYKKIIVKGKSRVTVEIKENNKINFITNENKGNELYKFRYKTFEENIKNILNKHKINRKQSKVLKITMTLETEPNDGTYKNGEEHITIYK